jgi:hypothetical protein
MSFQHEFLTSLSARITACIAANEAADVDANARWFLNSLTHQLKRYRINIAFDIKGYPEFGVRGAAVRYGPNGYGPAIDDLIRQSEWHRERGRVAMLVAAE